jgi:hypothetical protein
VTTFALPTDGGCWYCHRKDDRLVFCSEFDTYIHEDCIKARIAQQRNYDPELEIIRREFDI